MRTLALRAALAVLAPAVLLSTGGVALAQPTSSRATAEDTRLLPYATPGQLVDIGARRINLVCSGSGGPTVVLMAGSSSWSFVWYLTQPEIAEQSACLRLRQSCLWIQRSGATATSHARRGERPACGTQVRGSTSALCSSGALFGGPRSAVVCRAMAAGDGRHGTVRYQPCGGASD